MKFVMSDCRSTSNALSFPECTTGRATEGIVPRRVNFSGKAQDEQGKPLPGIISISFAIFKDQFEGAPLCMETQNATVDAEGNSPET